MQVLLWILYTLGAWGTKIQDNALHGKKSSGTSNSEGIIISNPRLQPIDSKKVVLQEAVREMVTRQGLVNRNKIDSYIHIFDLNFRVFVTLYMKPKQARHLRDCVGLKHNSDALVRKQQGQSFFGEVFWIDSVTENDQEHGDLALMTNTGDESPSTLQVRILTRNTFCLIQV